MGERVRPLELDIFVVRMEEELEFRQRQAGLWGKWSPLAFAVFISLFTFSAVNLCDMLSGMTDFEVRLRICMKFLINPLVILSCVAWTIWRFLFTQQRAWENEVKRVKHLLMERAKAGVCKHQGECSCKEQYLRYMRTKYNINA